ncbi:hypothetical protein BV898_14761 [Hypsibius exemplaris]|uniref:G-protein coupled receptors family 1 profile domain-containing protein n=1 Tax=Hypsibius exemplaris TaxID=2072580 RepID=A0A9X6RJL7_HYPEX|nr:hypothetical protein BV898_14761 [Hypsibius exemplaris]
MTTNTPSKPATWYPIVTNETNTSISPSNCNWPGGELFLGDLGHFPALWITIVNRPILLGLGTIGSLLLLWIQLRDTRKCSANIYLAVMAVCSIFILWAPFPNYLLLVESGNHFTADAWAAHPTLQRFEGFLRFLQESAVCISDCTLVAFSVDRLLCTLRPQRYLNVFTAKQALHIELIIILLMLLWNSAYLGITHHTALSPLIAIWNAIMTTVDAFSFLSVWIIMVTTSVILAFSLVKRGRDKSVIVAESTGSSNGATGSAVLLLCCTVLYSITQLPYIIFKLLAMARESPHCWLNISTRDVTLWLTFGGNLSLVGYSIHFYVFYIFSSSFRQRVHSLCSSSSNGAGTDDAIHSNDSSKRPLQAQEIAYRKHDAAAEVPETDV